MGARCDDVYIVIIKEGAIYLFTERVFLHGPGWFPTTDVPAGASRAPGLQVCTTMPGLYYFHKTKLELQGDHMVVHASNPSTWEAKLGGFQV